MEIGSRRERWPNFRRDTSRLPFSPAEVVILPESPSFKVGYREVSARVRSLHYSLNESAFVFRAKNPRAESSRCPPSPLKTSGTAVPGSSRASARFASPAVNEARHFGRAIYLYPAIPRARRIVVVRGVVEARRLPITRTGYTVNCVVGRRDAKRWVALSRSSSVHHFVLQSGYCITSSGAVTNAASPSSAPVRPAA